MFPDFLCIGAQKAGTTWLHHNLAQQSDIWLPPVKEIHFLDHSPPNLFRRVFSRRTHHQAARTNALATVARFLRRQAESGDLRRALSLAYGGRDWRWYEALFPDDPALLCGEICPGYARLSEEVVQSIVNRNPQIKVIYLLRDPIDRAWSAVAMHYRKQPGQSISDHPSEDVIARLETPKTLAHCQFERNISCWLDHVPREQVYFGFFDRIVEDPKGYLADILEFLGCSTDIVPETAHLPVNTGMGEQIAPDIESRIARLLKGEAMSLHHRFANRYTERWLAHANAAAALTREI